MTLDEYHALVEHGILGKVELLNGTVWCGNHRLAFSAEQIAAAAELGVDLRAAAASADSEQPSQPRT